ncbi:DUF3047 domain-containing protein [Desulfuromonas carbonis]|uniref:DUF3047 domain-containing protein n=1 Tax=Desulfuromonas sp. DDH964 TaxID=1823759 RepID=UPI00078EEA2F|nr:DUF3047 domain-containing protein [Desulfuromonas sp. DDH964]AMV73226.1 hypothetical protein DBW_2917 [Desulfuromonas sp. DDH964]
MLLLTLWFGLLSGSVGAGSDVRSIDDFEHGLAPGWRQKSFAGETSYRVVADGGGHVLAADSRAAASGLVYKIEYDPQNWPVLAWRWKVEKVLAAGDARHKGGDDYPARLYVVFPSWFFPKTRSLNYIWANKLPKEALLPNPFTANAMMIAVESGPERVGEWVEERRNVVADYRRAFGSDPPAVGAIALMTDTDNTGDAVRAWYDDIRLARE